MVITAGRVAAGVRRRHEVVYWAFILVVQLTVFEDRPRSSHFMHAAVFELGTCK